MTKLPTNLNDLRTTWRVANKLAEKSSNICHVKNVSSVDFYLYDLIGLEEGQAETFVKAVSDAKGKAINLFINSPGGFVWDAIAMYDALINSGSEISVTVNGLAASAASFIAQAASPEKLKIAEPGRMMIHDAQGVGIGSPAEMQEYTDLLHSVSDDISRIYAKRAGGEPKAWRKAMSATTWYNSSEAVDSKLADSVTNNAPTNLDNRTRLIQARARVLLGGK